MHNAIRGLVFAGLAALYAACSWIEPGRIVTSPGTTRESTAVGFGAMMTAVSQADVILIGEAHDIAAHHINQAQIIRRVGAIHGGVHVVMEMLDLDDRNPRPRIAADDTRTWNSVKNALAWESSGWPDWKMYQPIFAAARAVSSPVYAGLPPKSVVRALMPEKSTANTYGYFEPGDRTAPMPAANTTVERSTRSTSHCNLLDSQQLVHMARGQRARDAGMARTILALVSRRIDSRPVVLIAGNGHVRTDYGVPWHLDRLAGSQTQRLKIVTIGQYSEPTQSVESDPADTHVYDFVVYQGRSNRPDPCEGLGKHFKATKTP